MTACYDCYLVDLDGTLYWGDTPIPRAVEAINRLTVDVIYVTNNASREPAFVAEKLRSMGFPADVDCVVTSAQLGVQLLLEHVPPPAEVLVLGTSYLKGLVKNSGYIVSGHDSPHTKVVIQGHSTDTGWYELSAAARAIRNGAIYIATNKDMSLPSEKGLNIGNGAMVKAVECSTGAIALTAGKPSASAFTRPVQYTQSSLPLIIGDCLDTDIRGAVSAGYDSLCVLTGVANVQAICNAPEEKRPTFVCKDLAGLQALISDNFHSRLSDITASSISQVLMIEHDCTDTATVHFKDNNISTVDEELSLFIAWAWQNNKKVAFIKGATLSDYNRLERWRYSDYT